MRPEMGGEPKEMSRPEYKHWCRNCKIPLTVENEIPLNSFLQMFEAYVGFAEHVERALNMPLGDIRTISLDDHYVCLECALGIIGEFNKTRVEDNQGLVAFHTLVDLVVGDYSEVILGSLYNEEDAGLGITKTQLFLGLDFLVSLADVYGLSDSVKKWRAHVDTLKYQYGWSERPC